MCSTVQSDAGAARISSTQASSTQKQGIQGKVQKISGNYMPGISADASAQSENVSTTVWIFAGQIPGNQSAAWPVAAAEQHSDFLCQVTSDQQGNYIAYLPPGEYTVFAQYGEVLYLNVFQGNGSYESVEVVAGQLSQIDLIHTAEAFF